MSLQVSHYKRHDKTESQFLSPTARLPQSKIFPDKQSLVPAGIGNAALAAPELINSEVNRPLPFWESKHEAQASLSKPKHGS